MLKPVTEQELAEQDHRTGAPRVTLEHIEAVIAHTYLFTAGQGVKATRGEYNRLRDWATPVNEDPSDEGYLVEYADGGKPNDSRFRGYISWSPKDVFDRAYGSPVA